MSLQSRPLALCALENVMRAAFEEDRFSRNPDSPVEATRDGMVIMTDGDPGEPEYILGNPMLFAFEHQVEFEIAAKGDDRAAVIEAYLAKFEPALAADRGLGGTVDDARIMFAPEIHDYMVDGAETERSAVVKVQLSYTAASAAG